MSFINKPKIAKLELPRNELGLTRRDYEGAMSTLCAGCGHDSVTAAIIEAVWDLSIAPEQLAKLSGIGCSSKTTAYFVSGAHGFNSVHGRMPSIASGASAANRELHYLGVSGDGDSLSIGFGQLAHAIRRNVNMLYICENNGVYGLTKGQFSAAADVGSVTKKGEANKQSPIDPALTALTLGGTFVARSFSGDKNQLVPLIKAGLKHRGFALIDVLSPCVTFNDHEGSTKSYSYVRNHFEEAVHADYIPLRKEITTEYSDNALVTLHDGSHIRLHKVAADYDPTNRAHAMEYLRGKQSEGQYVTGLLYVDPGSKDFHEVNETAHRSLSQIPYEQLSPGNKALDKIMSRYR
ncbi:MAG TPA: 2-oxoacid:ferredoxin oxidoreductase subunit beta [Steroidobacteraceae bacterium]|nr:2-oxoacid:ferredoxin oxidoreductase subunit beta [Steroidobacteraceae bacterium]